MSKRISALGIKPTVRMYERTCGAKAGVFLVWEADVASWADAVRDSTKTRIPQDFQWTMQAVLRMNYSPFKKYVSDLIQTDRIPEPGRLIPCHRTFKHSYVKTQMWFWPSLGVSCYSMTHISFWDRMQLCQTSPFLRTCRKNTEALDWRIL